MWFLDGRNLVRENRFAPMSEGIALVGDKVAVLTESGAQKYQLLGKGPVDHLILYDRKQLTGES